MEPLMHETIWFDKARYEDAETMYQEKLAGTFTAAAAPAAPAESSGLVSEIARARAQIQKSLNTDGSAAPAADNAVLSRIEAVEQENKDLRKITDDLRQMVKTLENRISSLESSNKSAPAPAPAATKPAAPAADDDDDDDDFELFGDDDEADNEAAEKLKQERISAYTAKKSAKPTLIAKSNIILDVKPWDDETDMKKLEESVRSITMDGLLWGASKFVAVGYGIRKLQISCVVEDDKISTDDLEEQICAFEDYIQSMDIAAFNKV